MRRSGKEEQFENPLGLESRKVDVENIFEKIL